MLDNIKNILLIIAIIVLTSISVNKGLKLIFDKQQKEFNTQNEKYNHKHGNMVCLSESCETVKQYNKDTYEDAKEDVDVMSRENLDNMEKSLNSLQFRTQVGASVLLLICATFIPNQIVRDGIMGGCVVNVIYASTGYWRHMGEVEKFSVSTVSLVALVAFIMKKMQ
jgi:hypothetical protein